MLVFIVELLSSNWLLSLVLCATPKRSGSMFVSQGNLTHKVFLPFIGIANRVGSIVEWPYPVTTSRFPSVQRRKSIIRESMDYQI